MIDWNAVDKVFLDMDGTLLDLHFDNHFWLEHVPLRYAQARGLAPEEARAELLARYRRREGTLEWYCVDHWSRELDLDIVLLKQEVEHLIAVHPHVVDFLEALAARGKRRVLVTNAHQRSITLKMEKTRLAGHFDRIICAHDLGLRQEAPGVEKEGHTNHPRYEENQHIAKRKDPGLVHLRNDACQNSHPVPREPVGLVPAEEPR